MKCVEALATADFRQKQRRDVRKISMNKTKLERVSQFCYFGMTLTPTLSFSDHLKVKTANVAAMTILGNLQDIDVKLAVYFSKMKSVPLIAYC